MGWPLGGDFEIEDFDKYSIDREHVWSVSNMRIRPFDLNRNLNTFTDFVINTNYDKRDDLNYFDGRPSASNRGHYSDLHNMYNAVRYTNQTLHSNYYYGNTGVTGEPNKSLNNIFYPGDEYKGDIARIMFYMTLMYPHLTLVDEGDPNAFTGTIYYGYLDHLLEWSIEDPVSIEEILKK